MSMRIIIGYHESPYAEARVEEFMDHVVKTDLKFTGLQYTIERGDFTCIDEDTQRSHELFAGILDTLQPYGD